INGISFVVNKLDNLQIKEMRSLTDQYKQKFDQCIILNLSSNDKKTIYTVGVTDNITAKYSAQDIVKILNQLTNGKGGGRLDFAQGGGNEILNTEKLISKVEFYINEK
ncbi:MAG: alanine--tRNA ligase, partial [Rhodobacterales bacterium]